MIPRVPIRNTAEQQVVHDHGFRTNQKFEPLPSPTGPAPYRLDLATIIGADAAAAIRTAGQLRWHMVGDVGGVKSPQPQQIVADTMVGDFITAPAPSLLHLVGDVIYFNGERGQYYPQFYEPFSNYPAPIVAIPGNHDGDPLPDGEPSLAAFVDNFCSTTPRRAPEAQEVARDTMIQPNAYWTLTAPFLTIIGLYSNVPEGGRLDDHQIGWLHEELTGAPQDGALLLSVHHPPYSADAHHGGSAYIGGILDTAFTETGRTRTRSSPDTCTTTNASPDTPVASTCPTSSQAPVATGTCTPWPAPAPETNYPHPPVPDQHGLTLNSYVDDRHGYLRLTASAHELLGDYITVPAPKSRGRMDPSPTPSPSPFDRYVRQSSIAG